MKTDMPNWNDLRIFLEVGRNKTLAAAARKLGVDDSTISRRIASLESSLDVAVFERDHLGFRLTPTGEELLECVLEMESGALSLAESLGGRQRSPAGRVRIATMEGIASLYLSAEFMTFQQRYPDIQIELATVASLVQVTRREADLFISFFPNEGRGVCSYVVGEFKCRLYASPEYLQQHGTPATIEDLESHRFVSYIDDLVQLGTVRWLTEAVRNPKVVFHSSSMVSQMFSAAAGAGIVMLPSFARPARFGLTGVMHQEIVVSRLVWLTVHRDLQYASRIKAVTAFIEEIMQRDYPRP